MTPWPSDTRVLQVLPQSWRVPSQARSEHFGRFNFHQMWPHSVWPLCLTLVNLETFVWHDLGSFECQACQVYHFVRSSKLFSTLDLLKIQNCKNICSESMTFYTNANPHSRQNPEKAVPYWKSGWALMMIISEWMGWVGDRLVDLITVYYVITGPAEWILCFSGNRTDRSEQPSFPNQFKVLKPCNNHF